jgi:hypothetical protein
MNILSRFLSKKGISSADELDTEEKVVFNRWQEILAKGEVSVQTIKDFCQQQIDIIESKWKDFEYKDKEKLIPYHTVYKSILGAINGPKAEREQLERYLNQLIAQK